MNRLERESKTAELANTGVHSMNLLWNLSALGSKSLWLYNIADTYANSCGHISNQLNTHCMWTCLFLAFYPSKFLWSHLQPAAYTMHVIMLSSSMPPTQFTQHFCWNTCILFTLGTMCISCFCSQSLTFFKHATNTI